MPTVSHEISEKVEAIKNTVARAEGAVVVLVSSARLLPSDIIYCVTRILRRARRGRRSCGVRVSGEGLKGLREWFGGVRDGGFGFFGKKKVGNVEWRAKLEELKELRERVFVVLEEFRAERRHTIIDPYLPAFDDRKQEMPPHRYLFNSYVYQYHLTQMGAIVLELVCPFSPSPAYLC
ncbi:hypothetical protein K443DRAFT_15731 [Laccaria amethystina LaAM-08-1]|uniref:Uncharacterized protein n=1 Tax=Laccaria amethystina LaAM-08-1 TaxID=1095629 RepID=A0A0C9WZT8_9AGAR|nr:hypothetical protein K443DRAFT_15731 [Laccaria amethystina LaAM-08-1]